VASILITRVDSSHIPDGIYSSRVVQLLRTLHTTPITPAFLAGGLAVAIGGMVRLYCSSTLGESRSFALSIRKEHRLVTSGPYSVVRHPSYTAYILQYVGMVVMYGSQGSWMRESGVMQVPFVKVSAAIYFFLVTAAAWAAIRRSPVEDKMLQRALGEEWEEWAKRVQYRLFPGIH
jgi:protein-S-isoprenylcysteine O-methyltransferase Ste14